MDETNAVVLMTRVEAAARDQEIVESASTLRNALYDMYIHEGWKALDFPSWHQYLENVSERAGLTPQTLRKHTRTALLESKSGHTIGTFKEGSIRPINDILSNRKGGSDLLRVEALERAIDIAGGDEFVTETISRTAAFYVLAEMKVTSTLLTRMKSGEIDPVTALKLYDLVKGIIYSDDKRDIARKHIVEHCSEIPLAAALSNIILTGKNDDLIDEILASGHLPTSNGTQVRLEDASIIHLSGYMKQQSSLEYSDAKALERHKMYAVCGAAKNFILARFGNKIPDKSSHPYEYEIRKSLVELGMMNGGDNE